MEGWEVEGWVCSEMGGAGRTGGSGCVEARDEELAIIEVEFVGSELGKTAGAEFMESEPLVSTGGGLIEWAELSGAEGRDMGIMDTEEENNSAGGTDVSIAVRGRGIVEEGDREAGKESCVNGDSESSKLILLQEETSISGAVASGRVGKV